MQVVVYYAERTVAVTSDEHTSQTYLAPPSVPRDDFFLRRPMAVSACCSDAPGTSEWAVVGAGVAVSDGCVSSCARALNATDGEETDCEGAPYGLG